MLYQEEDSELDNEWLTANEQLTHFRKAREKIVGRFKGSESPSVQGTQSIRLVTSNNSRIHFMLYQEDDPELDNEWLTANEQLTHFIKAREKIVGRFKGSELPSV